MSLTEIAPQKPKEYDGRKQDHGDAAVQKGHLTDDYFGHLKREARRNGDAERVKSDLQDTDPVARLDPEELEAAANVLLGEEPILSYSSEKPGIDADSEDDSDVPSGREDRFATEADFGIKSRREVAKAMARRVTLDVDDGDDHGDDDFAVPVHIRNRL